MARSRQPQLPALTPGAKRCLRKFLQLFPQGYRDPEYVELERDYKWHAHLRWESTLSRLAMASLLRRRRFAELAAAAVAIESRTNLLFSFEKMALRDAVRTGAGARLFAEGLYQFLHGNTEPGTGFSQWCATIGRLPRRQTRVLTWPMATVFGFLAQPSRHIFYKPRVTQAAARRYNFDLQYSSRPDWPAYERLLAFAAQVRRDTRHLGPRDLIDIQSFIWIQGSEEYE
ncbi:MAG TPA: hypothetical protein VJU17_08575 [Gemmatimonadales bacterium]|nr:hypothetical protein [Gemmatimonadales bacterium]